MLSARDLMLSARELYVDMADALGGIVEDEKEWRGTSPPLYNVRPQNYKTYSLNACTSF